jgi:hypothetical protein
MGRRAEAERMLQTATRANEQALISAGLGDRERTLAALEEMAAVGPQRVGHYLESPEMALVRDDPRLASLRRRVGLP